MSGTEVSDTNTAVPILDAGADVVPIESARSAEPLTQEQKMQLTQQFWTDVLMQIVHTERFLVWFDANYTVQKGVDEETKTVHVNVIEKPPVESSKNKLSPEQIFKLHMMLTQSGAREPKRMVEMIMKFIGQEDIPLITLATDADVKVALDQAGSKDKLEP